MINTDDNFFKEFNTLLEHVEVLHEEVNQFNLDIDLLRGEVQLNILVAQLDRALDF